MPTDGDGHQPDQGWEVFETGTEPEYFVTHSRTEQAGGGNIRVFCYAERRLRQLHLLYTVIVPAKHLAEIARRGLAASEETDIGRELTFIHEQ